MTNDDLIKKTKYGTTNKIKAENGKYIYLYKTTCLIDNNICVGIRVYKFSKVESDSYIGCGVIRRQNGEILLSVNFVVKK